MKEFVKALVHTDEKNVSLKQRKMYACICSVLGILLNLLLFIMKMIVGIVSHSMAVQADAWNNLSDAATTAMELYGFKMAALSPGEHHPCGHGRIELIMSLCTADIILFMGYELFTSSLASIKDKAELCLSSQLIVVLVISILVKLVMYFYNTRISKKIDSIALKAIAADCISDSIATLSVLLSALITYMTGVWIDGYVSILVSIFILWNGCVALKDAFVAIMGSGPDEELVSKMHQMAAEYKEITAIRNLYVHDYGEGRKYVAMNVECSYEENVEHLQTITESLSRKIRDELGYEVTIQLDRTYKDKELEHKVAVAMKEQLRLMKSSLCIDQLHFIRDEQRISALYVLRMPYQYSSFEEEWKERLDAAVKKVNPELIPLGKVCLIRRKGCNKKRKVGTV